jgi:phosphopantothenoylcysteine decarboxylase/phosphopantothenate--cysteine ligase
MGYALAQAAVARGAKVVLVTAAALPDPAGCTVVRVTTAGEMAHAVLDHLPEATVVIKAAAVSDYRARTVAPTKLRRSGSLTVEMEPTEDIAEAVVQQRRPGTVVIAFAAETEDLEASARSKLLRKGVDAVVANDVSQPGIGFESDENAGLLLTRDNTVALPRMTKALMAERILDQAKVLRSEAARESFAKA